VDGRETSFGRDNPIHISFDPIDLYILISVYGCRYNSGRPYLNITRSSSKHPFYRDSVTRSYLFPLPDHNRLLIAFVAKVPIAVIDELLELVIFATQHRSYYPVTWHKSPHIERVRATLPTCFQPVILAVSAQAASRWAGGL
jgi:hypothetical protein